MEMVGVDRFGTLYFGTSDQVVMHLCDNPPCFRYDHLRVGTTADNTADMLAKDRQVKRQPKLERFTADELAEIRSSDENQYQLAARFGVSQSTI